MGRRAPTRGLVSGIPDSIEHVQGRPQIDPPPSPRTLFSEPRALGWTTPTCLRFLSSPPGS